MIEDIERYAKEKGVSMQEIAGFLFITEEELRRQISERLLSEADIYGVIDKYVLELKSNG